MPYKRDRTGEMLPLDPYKKKTTDEEKCDINSSKFGSFLKREMKHFLRESFWFRAYNKRLKDSFT